MENKTTTQLLDLVGEYSVKERKGDKIPDEDLEEYVNALDELYQRPPFCFIFEGYYNEEEPSIVEKLSEMEENQENFHKKIKRHKHDPQSGDVMIRI